MYMLLLLYAGDSVYNDIASDEQGELMFRTAKRSVSECLLPGASHRDNVWARNILWDGQTGKTLYVDFDRTILFDDLLEKF